MYELKTYCMYINYLHIIVFRIKIVAFDLYETYHSCFILTSMGSSKYLKLEIISITQVALVDVHVCQFNVNGTYTP